MINIKHLGDITKISGYTAPITDVVVGGSPCQDLSVAGKRAGLDGERSGLFMEQIRIIKEMRDRDVRTNGRTGVDVRPRYMVWENVPGAFSSNKGEDFRIVLEETARIKDPNAVIPQPPNGKWQTSGCILGEGYSIVWRVLDAQFWGVPQRRRRIALVADFGGHSASEILFVRKGVCGNPQPSHPQRKATSADATRSIGADDIFCIDGDKLNKKEREGGSGIGYREGSQYTLTAKDVHGVAYSFEPGIASREGGQIYENVSGTLRAKAGDNQMATAYTMKIRSGCDVDANGRPAGKGALIQTDKSGTLSCVQDQYLFQPVYAVENHPADSRVDIDDTGKVQTHTSRTGTGGGNVPMVMEQAVFSKSKRAQTTTDYETWTESDTACTLNAFDQGDVRANEVVCYSFDPLSSNSMKSSNPNSGCHRTEVARTIDTTNPDPSKNQGGVAVVHAIGNGQVDGIGLHKKAGALNCMHDQQAVMITTTSVAGFWETGIGYWADGIKTLRVSGERPSTPSNVVCSAVDCRNGTEDSTNGALQMGAFRSLNCNNVVRTRYTVRRLTPLECERLQGFPDGWTDIGEWTDSKGRVHKASDASRYKALGNSIALPPWKWVMKRLCACYERDATLASLFDGIGGFPYIWEQINGKGSCLWASEIEEFPIAVTKARIGE